MNHPAAVKHMSQKINKKHWLIHQDNKIKTNEEILLRSKLLEYLQKLELRLGM